MMRTRNVIAVMICAVLSAFVGGIAVARQSAVLAEPTKIVVIMPDYQLPRRMWIAQGEEIERQLKTVAQEAMRLAVDDRLQLEQRLDALYLTRFLSADTAAETLIGEIEFRDTRGVGFGGPPLGEYPAVALLQRYGSSIMPYAIRELLKPQSDARRRLICDVMVGAVSHEKAESELREWLNGRQNETERENLKAAIDELAARVRS